MEDEDDEQEQADVDAMDQDLIPSESESVGDIEIDDEPDTHATFTRRHRRGAAKEAEGDLAHVSDDEEVDGVQASRWASVTATSSSSKGRLSSRRSVASSLVANHSNEGPSRPRARTHGPRRR